MVDLRYSSGNLFSPQVHRIGILALGSHLENHGAALPIDTDAKIASYLALKASLISGAKFLGILYAATEYPYVKHGKHMEAQELVQERLIPTLKTAKKCLKIDYVIIVNAHGGNTPIIPFISSIEEDLGLEVVFNNKIVEIEGPHAGSGEISLGAVLGIVDISRLDEHCDFDKYPEVGMVGLEKARYADKGIDKGAQKLFREGVELNLDLGQELIDITIKDILKDIKKILKKIE